MLKVSLLLFFCLASITAFASGRDVSVPSHCTPEVNRNLENLIRSHTTRNVDNIMVCGIATEKSRVNRGGPHGSHHVITVSVNLPDDGNVLVQVVSNDDLNGEVTANTNDAIYAYGQGYIAHGKWVAGIHDIHCSTHPSADNGWVVVNGNKTPKSCSAF